MVGQVSDYILKVNSLSKQFGKRTVVDNISFQIRPGQILGLLGPNGAGKTTIIRMLMGLSRPTSGSAEIFGFDLIKQIKQIHSRIGVVFEKPNLFESLSGYQNLAVFCRLCNQSPAFIKPLLERMELLEYAHEPVKVYSKGIKQRILILRALIHQPQLLFLDEPCSGLDPVSARIIRDYLLELKREGISILLTSHNMEEVDELCDLIGFINHGKLIVLADKIALKQEFGSRSLRVTYQKAGRLCEEILDPTPENFVRINQLYSNNQVVSVHSMEASLSEIFRKLSAN